MKPRFIATALPTICHHDTERACQAVATCFPEALPPPILRTRGGSGKMPCTQTDEQRKVTVFDLSPARQPELLDFYEHYLADDVDHFALSRDEDPALYRLAGMYRDKPWTGLEFLHCLTIGPYTAGLSLKDEAGAPAFYNEQMRDIIVKYLAMRAKWRVREVQRMFPGIQVLTLMVEPALNVYTSSIGAGTWDDIRIALDEVLGAAGDGAGGAGVHCCSNFDWSLLMGTVAKVVNFDAFRYGETMALYGSALTEFLTRGGTVAWGIVPTHDADVLDTENAAGLVEKLEHTMDLVVEKGVDRDVLMESSWVTPSCDIVSLSVERGERVYELTREVSQLMRAKYFA
jgi:hypothetical protein